MKNTLLTLALVFALGANAQHITDAPWFQNANANARTSNSKVTFAGVQKAFNDYWVDKDPNVKGSGFKPFKRWENYWSYFVKPDGTLPTNKELWESYLEAKQMQDEAVANGSDNSRWEPLGPFTHKNTGSWSNGQGRVNFAMPDPNNPTKLFVGAPAGGLWISNDDGKTWKTTTEKLPQIGVSGVAVDFNDSNIVYIATGDDDAGDSVSVGVWKSTDGGETWKETGLNPNNSPSSMNDIYIDPKDSNKLWVATNRGVYRTTDAGKTWKSTLSNTDVKDIKVKPGDTNVIYAASKTSVYKSTDSGASFSKLSGLPTSGVSRIVLDVTPANPRGIYVLCSASKSLVGIYKSTNEGSSFSRIASSGVVESGQAWYDLAFAVSDKDENLMFGGELNVWRTKSGGSFSKINEWNKTTQRTYTHADIHFIRIYNGVVYVGSDGGVYRSKDGGNSFTSLTDGLQIGQFYRIAVPESNIKRIVGGLQDNGGYGYKDGAWGNWYGADGMDVAVDPRNENKFYGFIQMGQLMLVSSSAGQSSDGQIEPGVKGNWITPLAMSADGTLYAGYSSLYKLSGSSFSKVSSRFSGNLDYIEVDDLNTSNIYASAGKSFYKSTNKGSSFSRTKSFGTPVSSIEVHNDNSSIVYVTTKGTGRKGSGDGKVYISTDGGKSFNDITGNLPNVTKNIIRHEKGDEDNSLYLGTSVGVYTYNDESKKWIPFTKNMPNTSVSDLEVIEGKNKIIASTYGRGIWMSDLDSALSTNDVNLASAFKVYPNPSRGIFNIQSALNSDINIRVVDVTGKQILNRSVDFGNGYYKLDLSGAAQGVYFLEIEQDNSKATKKLILE